MDNWLLGAAWAIALGFALLQAVSVGATENGKVTNMRTARGHAELTMAGAADGDRIELGSGACGGSYAIGARIMLVGIDAAGSCSARPSGVNVNASSRRTIAISIRFPA